MRPIFNPRNPSVIQDITPFDKRYAHIDDKYGSHLSIGELDTKWRRKQQKLQPDTATVVEIAKPSLRKKPSLKQADISYFKPFRDQESPLVVRMKTLDLYAAYWLTRLQVRVLKPELSGLHQAFTRLGEMYAHFIDWIKEHDTLPKVQVIPTIYRADKGVVTSLDTPAMHWTRRGAIPIAVVAIVLAATAIIWEPSLPAPFTSGHAGHAQGSTAAAGSKSSKPTNNNALLQKHPTSSGSVQTATAVNQAQAPVNPTTSVTSPPAAPVTVRSIPLVGNDVTPVTSTVNGLTGGKGGGTVTSIPTVTMSPGIPSSPTASSPSPSTSTVPPVPGVTSPMSTTLPAQSISLDGKNVISTSPQVLTLN